MGQESEFEDGRILFRDVSFCETPWTRRWSTKSWTALDAKLLGFALHKLWKVEMKGPSGRYCRIFRIVRDCKLHDMSVPCCAITANHCTEDIETRKRIFKANAGRLTLFFESVAEPVGGSKNSKQNLQTMKIIWLSSLLLWLRISIVCILQYMTPQWSQAAGRDCAWNGTRTSTAIPRPRQRRNTAHTKDTLLESTIVYCTSFYAFKKVYISLLSCTVLSGVPSPDGTKRVVFVSLKLWP